MRKGTKALLNRLKDELPNLMHAWEPCDNAADYKCAFCQERSNTNMGDITHKDDCLGKALERELSYV